MKVWRRLLDERSASRRDIPFELRARNAVRAVDCVRVGRALLGDGNLRPRPEGF